MAARPEGMVSWPQVISVNGSALLSRPMTRKASQIRGDLGTGSLRSRT